MLIWCLLQRADHTEIVNELSILGVTWCSMGLMVVTEEDSQQQQDLTGWMLVSVLLANIAFNFITVTFHFFLNAKLKVRRLFHYIKHRRRTI
jgi:hypothetical protein